jgi:spore coat polysaccharide biosynthesis protein SpsF (cytidylyltransferase family)
MSVYVKGGTPLDSPSLCDTCVNAHLERGYRESEALVFCQATYPEHRVRFRVRECSSHTEKQKQTLYQMQKMAWILDQRPDRKVGFVPAAELEKETNEVELILDKHK